ncbi:ras association domain-containing protein 5 isoform X2 [Hypomesus transpacificus]|uniref:ras association domain-containing protein 5 isoform X2 n=1 Tax=Hypomesus transpacificus TaxID=137520 RepID=UPI001F0809F0|nr:ras association domain-containing protein 5 isoform X2 [Hypomesus transpacificus]
MASVSLVGQHPCPHRLDSEPQLFLPKLTATGIKKFILPRKSSLEKMMFRKSSGSGECGSVTNKAMTDSAASVVSLNDSFSPAQRDDKSRTGGEQTEKGCGIQSETPRRPVGDRKHGTVCDTSSSNSERSTTGTEGERTNQRCDNNSNVESDSNQNAGGRRGDSLKKTAMNVISNTPVSNEHNGAQSHMSNGKRAYQASTGHHTPLQLTQSKTGVVKLARTEPRRREAWSIFVRTETGHRFEPKTVTQDWCDACSRQITAQALKCQKCTYTCHLECRDQVQLECNQRDRKPEETPSPTPSPSSHHSSPPQDKNETKEEDRGTKALSEEEVRARIEEYNAQISENVMKLADNGSYTGFIKVHLRLSRPVTVPTLEEGQQGAGSRLSDKRTSFYLPCDCVKQLHISSTTTVREVIQGLLKKFMVLDNPRKFALYRQTHRDGQDLFQKLPVCERPLSLRLIAGPDPDKLSFILKENETGEVEWHAFSVPELQNFLVILEKEETERVRVVEQKYSVYRQKLQQALRQHNP